MENEKTNCPVCKHGCPAGQLRCRHGEGYFAQVAAGVDPEQAREEARADRRAAKAARRAEEEGRTRASALTIAQVIERICAFHPPMEDEHSCDVIKWGDARQECTGVVCSCFATVNVLRRAAELGANLIVVHEPSFYSNPDDTQWLAGVAPFEEKKRLLEEHGMVIWRDHDHIHAGPPDQPRTAPDMIFVGIMKMLGWEDYVQGDPLKPLEFRIPPTTARELTAELCRKLHLRGARVVGDPDARVERVFIPEHIGGRDAQDRKKILRCENEGFDALLPLETVDWTILEYVTDSCQAGRPRAVISLGHFNLEEAAMGYMAENWLPELLEHAVPVHYVQSGDHYRYITVEDGYEN